MVHHFDFFAVNAVESIVYLLRLVKIGKIDPDKVAGLSNEQSPQATWRFLLGANVYNSSHIQEA